MLIEIKFLQWFLFQNLNPIIHSLKRLVILGHFLHFILEAFRIICCFGLNFIIKLRIFGFPIYSNFHCMILYIMSRTSLLRSPWSGTVVTAQVSVTIKIIVTSAWLTFWLNFYKLLFYFICFVNFHCNVWFYRICVTLYLNTF